MSLLINILSTRIVAKMLLRPMLSIHTLSYKLSGLLASVVHDSTHPKHQIMKYKEWFSDNIGANDIVLDVGCNTGMMPEVMSLKASFVYGIEIEEKHVDIAKKLRSKINIEFICADATTYDYAKCSPIDVVTLSNVLEHIEHREPFLKALINQISWNNPNCKKLLIRVPMVDRDWITIYKKENFMEYRLDNTHFIEYTYDDFKSELLRAGVGIDSYHIRFGEIYAVCSVIDDDGSAC